MTEKETNAYAKGFKEGWDKAIEKFIEDFDMSFKTSLNYPEHYYLEHSDFIKLKIFLHGFEGEDIDVEEKAP